MNVKIVFDSVDIIDGIKDSFSVHVSMEEDVFSARVVNLEPSPEMLNGKADAIINTASGETASFPDGADGVPMKSLVVSMQPIQSLNGYDHPWPAGGGVNKLPPMVDGTYEGNGAKAVVVNGVATLSGTTTASGNAFIIPLAESFTVPSGCYYHLGNSAVNASFSPTIENGNNTSKNVSYSCSPANRITAELSSKVGQTYTRIRFYIGNGVTISGTYAPMMCLDNTARDFSPYSNICPITGLTGLSVYRTGANLFPPNPTCVYGKVRNDNGDEVVSSTSFYTTSFVPVKPSTQYTLKIVGQKAINSLRIYYLTANGGWISRTSTVYSTPTSFTTPAGCGSIEIQLSITGEQNLDNFDVYLSEGSTATEEPFGSTYSVDWSTQAGTVYGGTLDVVTGQLTVDRAMVDLGERNYTKGNRNTDNTGYVFYFRDTSFKNRGELISSQFKEVFNIPNWESLPVNCCNSASGSYIVFCADYSDAAAFKAAMNGVQLVYELATPLTYQLTPQEVRTLKGDNHVWSDAGDVDLTYVADTKLYIDNKIAQAIAAALNA